LLVLVYHSVQFVLHRLVAPVGMLVTQSEDGRRMDCLIL
jgi:hypothetical protein